MTSDTAAMPRTLESYAEAHGAGEIPTELGRGYSFQSVRHALACAADLGSVRILDDHFLDRPGSLHVDKLGAVYLKLPREANDPIIPRAHPAGERRKWWYVYLDIPADQRPLQDKLAEADPYIRSVQTGDDEPKLYHCGGDGAWIQYSLAKAMIALIDPTGQRDPRRLLNVALNHRWRQVSIPFAPEYPEPGKRIWNRYSVQLKHKPQPGGYPHWSSILCHVFQDLDGPLKQLGWAKAASIESGHDYAMTLLASLVRRPSVQWPFLFLFGKQDGGKSIFHESIQRCLVTGGVVSGDRALTSDFTGELDGSVLVAVEERDVSQSPGAYARLKAMVTGETIAIRRMRTDTYSVPNYTHWVMCANERSAVPILHGDTRVQFLHVPPLAPGAVIPKKVLLELLNQEGPAFTDALLNWPLPEPITRLALPIVETDERRAAVEKSLDDLVTGLVALMGDSPQLRVTVRQIKNDLPHLDKAPGNIRSIKKRLDREGEASYLKSLGIRWWDEPDPDGSSVLVLQTQALDGAAN